MKQSSAETATKLSNQKCRDVSLKVASTKGQMNTDHSQALVIASILTRRQSRKHSATSKLNVMQPGPQSPQKKFRQTAKKLAGKVVKRTLNVSKPSRAGRFPGIPKYQKKNVVPDRGRSFKDQKRVSQVSEKGSANHVARLLRSQTPRILTKVQPKTAEDKRERKKRRHHKHKKAVDETHQDAILKIKKRVKYLLNRIKLEQNLIDAYSAEGWKGQSREKIRPERELQRAEAQIIRFQLGIREAVQQLDSLGLEGSIEDSVFDSQGRIYHEDIFCAKCKLQDALEDNDIILCDGACNRAFHQLCLEPPLRTEDIPPGDDGWLCPVCECKLECLDVVNAYLGTCYHVDDHWKKIFAEAAAVPSGDGELIPAVEEWPSEDSEDDDYNPDYDDHQTCRQTEDHEGSNDLGGSSDQSLHGKVTASDSSDEDSEISLFDEFAQSELFITGGCEGKKNSEEPGLEDEDNLCLVEGKRQRKEVDYKKLHDEMFGKDALAHEASEDEEWGPRKRLKKIKQSDDFFQRDSKVLIEKRKPFNEDENLPSTKPSDALDNKQSRVRLPPNAVEKLRAVFKENPLPSKTCKEGLSRQLGLSFQKVNFWFKNVRYAALKKGLVQRTNNRTKPSTGRSHCVTEAVPGFHLSAPTSKIMNGVRVCEEKIIEQKIVLSGLLLEMEILCDAQLKVEKLKRKLQEERVEALACDKVMYVAVAELREKVLA